MGGCTGRLPHPFSFHNKRYFQPHLSLCSFTPPQQSCTRILEGKTDALAMRGASLLQAAMEMKAPSLQPTLRHNTFSCFLSTDFSPPPHLHVFIFCALILLEQINYKG